MDCPDNFALWLVVTLIVGIGVGALVATFVMSRDG